MMLDYAKIIERHRVATRGVIHIGGYVGNEDANYAKIGFKNRVFVEAQPDTFETLQKNLAGRGAFCEYIAISDRPGRTQLHVTGNGQSSSILPLKNHSKIYPGIVEIGVVDVETIRLDDLMDRPKYRDLEFNFLNMDIQGAELLALSGGIRTLKQMDLVNLEVNFDELYAGAPNIRELDAFMAAFDFIRIDTVLAHPTWGDAMYIKTRFTRVGRI
jgi:FkbM family methyltransferase